MFGVGSIFFCLCLSAIRFLYYFEVACIDIVAAYIHFFSLLAFPLTVTF